MYFIEIFLFMSNNVLTSCRKYMSGYNFFNITRFWAFFMFLETLAWYLIFDAAQPWYLNALFSRLISLYLAFECYNAFGKYRVVTDTNVGFLSILTLLSVHATLNTLDLCFLYYTCKYEHPRYYPNLAYKTMNITR